MEAQEEAERAERDGVEDDAHEVEDASASTSRAGPSQPKPATDVAPPSSSSTSQKRRRPSSDGPRAASKGAKAGDHKGPSTRRSPKEDAPVVNPAFTCSACTFVNPRTASRCEVCDSPLTAPVVEAAPPLDYAADWSCGACTFMNPQSNLQCAVCSTMKPTPPSASGWTCSFCGETGLDHDHWSCRNCGWVKKDSSIRA